jgi:hypothetical protein
MHNLQHRIVVVREHAVHKDVWLGNCHLADEACDQWVGVGSIKVYNFNEWRDIPSALTRAIAV